jgi:hypothetical protein
MDDKYYVELREPLRQEVGNSSATEWPPRGALARQTSRPASATFLQTATSLQTMFVIKVEPAWAFDLSLRAERIKALRKGWDGIKSVPISPTIIEFAQNLVKEALITAGTASAPYLSPGGDGSLQVEWHTKTGEIELDISAGGNASVWIRSRNSDEEFEAEDEGALSLFARWAPRVAKTMDNERDVPLASNTSIYGSEAQLPFYKDDTIS